jgi:hypothetical protein
MIEIEEVSVMPLRDHFHGPLADRRSWTSIHGLWPAMIVIELNRKMPAPFVAEPGAQFGTSIEIDVATFEEEEESVPSVFPGGGNGGTAVATAVWAPPRPTLILTTDWPAQDEFEVRVYDTRSGRRLVAALEFVSPANKDRPEHRRAFVTKCAALLEERVSVGIIDLVTNRHANLFSDLLELLGQTAPDSSEAAPPIYAAACRPTKKEGAWRIEAWLETLAVGRPLPTLPLWLADNLAIPLDLESSYEETCRTLRIPPALPLPSGPA